MVDEEVRRHASAHARSHDELSSLPLIKLTIDDSLLSPVGQ